MLIAALVLAVPLGTAAAVIVARLSDRVADRLGLPRAPERCPMCGAVER